MLTEIEPKVGLSQPKIIDFNVYRQLDRVKDNKLLETVHKTPKTASE